MRALIQFAGSAFVHGGNGCESVPAVVTVRVVNPYHHFHLGLSPEARTAGRAQTDAGIEIGGVYLPFVQVNWIRGL